MGNHRLCKMERFHKLGTFEFKRLKVTALNLFHPTASPLLVKTRFFVSRHSLLVKGEKKLNLDIEINSEKDAYCSLAVDARSRGA